MLLWSHLIQRQVAWFGGRADKLLKHYIDNRFNMTEQDLTLTILRLSKCKIDQSDSRYTNLQLTVQRKINELQLDTRVRLACGLMKIKNNEKIVEQLLKTMRKNVKQMTFREVTAVSWVLAKSRIKYSDNVTYMMSLTERAHRLLSEKGAKLAVESIPPKTQESVPGEQEEAEIMDDAEIDYPIDEDTTKEIRPLDCSLMLWSIAASNMSDQRFFDFVMQVFVLQNMGAFETRMLVIILYACIRVKYHEKRQRKIRRVYKEIKERQLGNESVLTLKLLVESSSKFHEIDPEFMWEVAEIIKNKHGLEKMSPKFASQLLLNLTNKGLTQTNSLGFFVDSFFSNINDSNGLDCAMVLLSLYRTPFKTTYKNQIEILIKRLEKIYHSLDKKARKIVLEVSARQPFPSKILREKIAQQQSKAYYAGETK